MPIPGHGMVQDEFVVAKDVAGAIRPHQHSFEYSVPEIGYPASRQARAQTESELEEFE